MQACEIEQAVQSLTLQMHVQPFTEPCKLARLCWMSTRLTSEFSPTRMLSALTGEATAFDLVRCDLLVIGRDFQDSKTNIKSLTTDAGTRTESFKTQVLNL